MSHFAVNWLAVILATVVSWGFGAGWYMVLARQWTAAIEQPVDAGLGGGAGDAEVERQLVDGGAGIGAQQRDQAIVEVVQDHFVRLVLSK